MDAVNAFNQEVSCLQGSLRPELTESGGAGPSVALELAEQDRPVGLYGELAKLDKSISPVFRLTEIAFVLRSCSARHVNERNDSIFCQLAS